MAKELKQSKPAGKTSQKQHKPARGTLLEIDARAKRDQLTKERAQAKETVRKKMANANQDKKSSLLVSIKIDRLKHDAPRNAAELYKCLEILWGHAIPYTTTADYCDIPFEAFCSEYFTLDSDIIKVGPRGGGKTYDLMRGNYLRSVFRPGIDSIHAGATKSQGAVAINYLKDFSRKPGLRSVFPKPVTSTEALFNNGSHCKVVTGSMEGVSGHHPVVLTLDEIEFWDLEDVEQAFGVPIQKTTGERLLILASTRQRASSTMNYLVDNASERGFRVFLWSIFESMKNCPTCVAIDRAKYGDDNAKMKECLLWEDCHGVRGRLATGFIPRSEVIKIKARLSRHAWRTQYLCDKPVSSGLVLEDFEHEQAPLGNYTNWKFDPSRALYVAADPAEGQTAAAFFIQIDDFGRAHFFDECIVEKCQTNAQLKAAIFLHMLSRGYPLNCLEAIVLDFHRTDALAEFKSVTIGKIRGKEVKVPPFPTEVPKVSAAGNNGSNVEHLVTSLNVLRASICNGAGNRNLLVCPNRCPRLVQAIKNYSYRLAKDGTRTSETPKKLWSDEIDAVRYFIIWKNQMSRRNRRRGQQ